MNCEILSTLYIRSNGDIPCNDDAGEKILLGRVAPEDPDWDIAKVLTNHNYSQIREAFRSGTTPWPDTCRKCALLRPNEAPSDLLVERRIRKVQVEPSLACRLRCPCCSNSLQMRVRPKPFIMPLELFEAALKSLKQGSFTIGEFEYCGQGEPLLHPNFPRFVQLARDYFPDAKQRIITSGNFDYGQATGEEWIDEIFVSCDGLFQQSYEQYRVGGDVSKVIQFMKDVPKEIQGKRQLLVWKYILFEFNDGDEEIYQAQKLAYDMGVDIILFVFTHSDYKSRRYTAGNAEIFPIHFPNVVTNATPTHYRRSKAAALVDRQDSPGSIEIGETLCIIDEVAYADNKRLELRGWVLSLNEVTELGVSIDGLAVGHARLGILRPDVFAAHPEFGNRNSGFAFAGPANGRLSGRHHIDVSLLSHGVAVRTLYTLYDFP